MGGYGSGKSVGLVAWLVLEMAANANQRGGLIGADYPRLERDVLPILRDMLESSGCSVTEHKLARYWMVEPFHVRLELCSIEQPQRLRGPSWAFAAGDEAASWPTSLGRGIPGTAWEAIISRLRAPGGTCRALVVSTPEGAENWLSQRFASLCDERGMPLPDARDYGIVYSDTRQNYHLPAHYVTSLLGSFDAITSLEKVGGRPMSRSGGRVYFAYERARHVRPVEFDPLWDGLRVGLDFNVDPMSAVLFQQAPPGIRVVGELVLPGSNTWEMAKAIRAAAESLGVPLSEVHIYPDASCKNRSTTGTSNLEILRECGLRRIHMTDANPRVEERVNAMNGLLHHNRMVIDPKAVYLCRDLASVTTRKGTREIDKRDPTLTHSSDALGYAVAWLFPVRSRSVGMVRG
ncbi:MAG: hypothetical protein RJA59_1547 [Pseudomonadota bacterium]|jgi:hypothetical protein